MRLSALVFSCVCSWPGSSSHHVPTIPCSNKHGTAQSCRWSRSTPLGWGRNEPCLDWFHLVTCLVELSWTWTGSRCSRCLPERNPVPSMHYCLLKPDLPSGALGCSWQLAGHFWGGMDVVEAWVGCWTPATVKLSSPNLFASERYMSQGG